MLVNPHGVLGVFKEEMVNLGEQNLPKKKKIPKGFYIYIYNVFKVASTFQAIFYIDLVLLTLRDG